MPPAVVFAFISAELLFLLVRSTDLIVIAKKAQQRLPDEQQKIERGVGRALLLEGLLFVPTSVALLLLVAPIAWLRFGIAPKPEYYALLGIISYGFPFGTLRAIVTRVALTTLREFALLASKNPTTNDTQ